MINLSNPGGGDFEPLGGASGFVTEIHQVVKELSIFESFTLADHRLLCDYMVCFGTGKDVTLLSEGTTGDFLVIILTGEVAVIKESDETGKRLVVRVGPGGVLGEMSLIDGQPRSASCLTTQPTDFAVLTRHKLNAILAEHPPLGTKVLLLLLQLLTSRLRDTTTRMLPTIPSQAI